MRMRAIRNGRLTFASAVALATVLAVFAACDRQESGPAAGARPAGGGTAADHQGSSGKGAMFFPSGRQEGSSIRVDEESPSRIWVGREYAESITVTNVSPKDVENVVMTQRLSPNFKPSPGEGVELRDGGAVWNVGSLKAGETKTFRLSGTATRPGEVRHCLRVDFQPELCTTRTAAVAALELSAKAPKEALTCEPADVEFDVKNAGTATLDGVTVKDTLPEGLTVDGGTSDLSLDVGTIRAGETKTVKAPLRASHRGEFASKATASAEGVTTDAPVRTVFREPALDLAVRAASSAYTGSPARAEVVVTNTGDAPSPETVVEASSGGGVRFTEAAPGGRVSGGSAYWTLGTLAPGESRTLQMTYTGDVPADGVLALRAGARCAKPVQATARTEFRGVPAVLLEVTDNPDPVPVDGTVTYTITVTNQGNTPLHHVLVKCSLEEAMGFAGSDGPTPRQGRGTRRDVRPAGGARAQGEGRVGGAGEGSAAGRCPVPGAGDERRGTASG